MLLNTKHTNLGLKHGAMPVELKELSQEGEFEGYASIFGELDDGNDIMLRGAFKKSLKTMPAAKVRMLWQHSWHEPIGVWDEIREDDKGLFVRGHLLTDLQKGREAHVLLKAKGLDGMSIGYRTIVSTRDEKTGVRSLKEVELWEISLVTFPMGPGARVSATKGQWDEKELGRILVEGGLPEDFAADVVVNGLKAAVDKLGGQSVKRNEVMASLKALSATMKG